MLLLPPRTQINLQLKADELDEAIQELVVATLNNRISTYLVSMVQKKAKINYVHTYLQST